MPDSGLAELQNTIKPYKAALCYVVSLYSVANPGEGPKSTPVTFRPNGKKFWGTPPPPLSQGPDLAPLLAVTNQIQGVCLPFLNLTSFKTVVTAVNWRQSLPSHLLLFIQNISLFLIG